MKSLALIGIAFKRIRNHAMLSLLLVLSFALTIGIMVCVPAFSDAVGKQMVQEEINVRTQTLHSPVFPVRFISRFRSSGTMNMYEADYAEQWFENMIGSLIKVPIGTYFNENDTDVFYLQPAPGNTRYEPTSLDAIQVAAVQGIDPEVEIIEGVPFGSAVTDSDALPVWLEATYAETLAVQLGERFQLANPKNRKQAPVQVQVVGVFRATNPEANFWYREPDKLFDKKLVTTRDEAIPYFFETGYEMWRFNVWYYVLDETKLNLGRAESYIDALTTINKDLDLRLPQVSLDLTPEIELAKGYNRRVGLSVVLFGLSVPLMGLLFYFMISVSSMVSRFQQQEVATLASRGVTRRHIFLLTIVEVLVIMGISLPLGIALGLLLAQFMTYSQSFLGFGIGSGMTVHLASVDWLLVILGMGLGALARIIPGMAASRLTVVTFERWSARRSALVGGTRLLLIGLLVAATVYAYYRLAAMGTIGLIGIDPDDPTFDPLLLLAPSLFLLAAPIVASELFSLLMRPFAVLGKFVRSPAGFLGLVSLGREGGQYRTPVFMLVLCLTLGVFFASLASSADTWTVDRRAHEVGADLVFQPRDIFSLISAGFSVDTGGRDLSRAMEDHAIPALSTTDVGDDPTVFLLPLSNYASIEGVAAASRVGEYETSLMLDPTKAKGRMLAVDRVSFEQVAHFRSDYADESFGQLLNHLGQMHDGVLIPETLAEELTVGVGDRFGVRVMFGGELSHVFDLRVAGTFKHFSTYYDDEPYLLVANLDYLELDAGTGIPWSVWMALEPGVDAQDVLLGVRETQVIPIYPEDMAYRLNTDMQKLERRGLLGMLSVCFLAGAILAAVGLFVYSLASMLGRSFRFSIWQALGLHRGEVMAVVSLEYLATLLYGIVVGTAAGIAAAKLYVPLFRLTDSPNIPVPPYLPLIDWNSTAIMAGGLALALVAIELFMLIRVARTRVFEVLRLGTRE